MVESGTQYMHIQICMYIYRYVYMHVYIYIDSHPGVDRISDMFKNDVQTHDSWNMFTTLSFYTLFVFGKTHKSKNTKQ